MPELTLEAIERLLSKQLENLPTKKDLSEQTLELRAYTDDKTAEVLSFLTDNAAHKDDLVGLREHVDKKFAEQAVSLAFIESQLASVREDLEHLGRRTKEDAAAFVKDLIKLKNRMDQFERQLKRLKAAHA